MEQRQAIAAEPLEANQLTAATIRNVAEAILCIPAPVEQQMTSSI